jgi:dynein light chain roadblock-type
LLPQSEVDEAMARIQSEHRGVIGVVVANSEGVIIRSTFNSQFDVVDNYQAVIVDIVDRARQIIRENDELTFLKIRTKRVEYIVVPGECPMPMSVISILNWVTCFHTQIRSTL